MTFQYLGKKAMKKLSVFLCALLLAAPAFGQPKPLVVGVDGTFAPHAMPKLGGGVEGFNIDLVEAIGAKMGRKVEIFAGQFSALIPAMNSGQLTFVGAPTTVTPERASQLLFTEGYLNTYYSFVVAAKAGDVKTFDDLKGKTVSVNRGSAYDKWLQENAAKYGFKAEAFGTNADAVQALISGRAEVHMSGNTVAAYSVLRAKDQIKLASLKVDEGLVWGAAFRKDDAATRNSVEDALECLKLDGTVARLHEKWFGIKPAAGAAAITVYPGYGVPGLPGHDSKPHTPNCK
jgi:polar amino acid transport system substrate-binding protein